MQTTIYLEVTTPQSQKRYNVSSLRSSEFRNNAKTGEVTITLDLGQSTLVKLNTSPEDAGLIQSKLKDHITLKQLDPVVIICVRKFKLNNNSSTFVLGDIEEYQQLQATKSLTFERNPAILYPSLEKTAAS